MITIRTPDEGKKFIIIARVVFGERIDVNKLPGLERAWLREITTKKATKRRKRK